MRGQIMFKDEDGQIMYQNSDGSISMGMYAFFLSLSSVYEPLLKLSLEFLAILFYYYFYY